MKTGLLFSLVIVLGFVGFLSSLFGLMRVGISAIVIAYALLYVAVRIEKKPKYICKNCSKVCKSPVITRTSDFSMWRCPECGTVQEVCRGIHEIPKQICTNCGAHSEVSSEEITRDGYGVPWYTCPVCHLARVVCDETHNTPVPEPCSRQTLARWWRDTATSDAEDRR